MSILSDYQKHVEQPRQEADAREIRALLAQRETLRSALQGLVDALAANDEDGLTEFAEPMAAARAALK